ncbi:bifunctional folylpolyglutamate synthase/dihydrofolate synthase [Oceanobacillus halophilus]|uniref:Dihydrofolate synthase/folylpolyglutamate synthase n=1 Tax=Oceanobacillus halophilus TaxID=930130 RepID=A0A495A326_9BACI|nr:folylpolyglutamate synthase/dihydrofolate synthase family protein [Oceanobacillus halophilus]RKQ33923.1 bifunctional folylpolyglutamate synthase/dihydrofolate synthase [Oceanobacillus halophilus]
MIYEEAIQYINSPKYHGMKLGLDNIRALMAALGNPQKQLKFIHVAGTNGKGSVASYLAHILTEAGYKTGLFTSPYIEQFNERIQVNHEKISNESLGKITGEVKEKILEMKQNPTEFEIITAISFQYFYEQQCDIVVLEVGLGGKLDSTNVIDTPILSVITPISYDHQSFLGTTLTEIAGEKAGIIKENAKVLLYPQDKDAEEVIYQAAREKNAVVYQPDFGAIKDVRSSLTGQYFSYQSYQDLQISLLGEHQLKNAALAIEAVHLLNEAGFSVHDATLRKGLSKTTWPGRFEIIHQNPVVVIDGAHNIDSIQALVDNLTKYFSKKKIIAILGVLKDKDVDKILEEVSPVINQFITVTPDSPRAVGAEELATLLEEKNIPVTSSETYEEAVQLAFQEAREDDVICAFGSLYYIGAVRRIVRNRK